MSVGLAGLLARAGRLAQKRSQRLCTAHLLWALADEEGVPADVLANHGLPPLELLEAVAVVDEEPSHAVELAVERAEKIAHVLGDGVPTSTHLLIAITRQPRSAGYRCLERLGAVPAQVSEHVLIAVGGAQGRRRRLAEPAAATRRAPRQSAPPPSYMGPLFDSLAPDDEVNPSPEDRGRQAQQHALAQETERKRRDARTPSVPPLEGIEPAVGESIESAPHESIPPAPALPLEVEQVQARVERVLPVPEVDRTLERRRFPLLTSLARNLSAAAADGEFDPVIGRDDEIEQLLDVLARRRANNPVLVGPPGVGKTAVVEGLAAALVEAGVERPRVIAELSAGALISGTGVRGALAERLATLRQEVADAGGEVVLFIDEIHTLVGQGEGADSVGNELKTALARGELPCIGATTDEEYRKVFERDAALARRFTRVDIEEPSPEDCQRIVRGAALEYEKHHGVAYAPEALTASVEMSVRFIPEQKLPDKAIGVIDQAAARVKRRGGKVVDVESIAQVISEQASVPVERLLMRDGAVLLELESHLGQRIIGQPEAVGGIAAALRKSAAGFNGRRPLGTFLLLGPTGVGKTEMAKGISDLMFPASEMLRFDMSEFSEGHTVARLLGAPPGYVGHEDGGQLTEAVRRHPYRLLLLDEVEKAHPDVLMALLPLLDEGRLTDGRGHTVDFTNTVIVMTSNLGVAQAVEPRRIGFSGGDDSGTTAARTDAILVAARAALPPELWNRIDEPLCFGPLGKASVAKIARRLIDEVAALVERTHDVACEIDDSVIDVLIAAGGFDPELGARPMRRMVSRMVEAKLASAVLGGDVGSGECLVLRGRDGAIEMTTRQSDIVAAE